MKTFNLFLILVLVSCSPKTQEITLHVGEEFVLKKEHKKAFFKSEDSRIGYIKDWAIYKMEETLQPQMIGRTVITELYGEGLKKKGNTYIVNVLPNCELDFVDPKTYCYIGMPKDILMDNIKHFFGDDLIDYGKSIVRINVSSKEIYREYLYDENDQIFTFRILVKEPYIDEYLCYFKERYHYIEDNGEYRFDNEGDMKFENGKVKINPATIMFNTAIIKDSKGNPCLSIIYHMLELY